MLTAVTGNTLAAGTFFQKIDPGCGVAAEDGTGVLASH